MARLIIREKLEALRRCVARIEDKAREAGDRLETDIDVQDILILNLTRAVQLCVDMGSVLIAEGDREAPRTMAEVFTILGEMGVVGDDLRDIMIRAVGFRDLAVHQYDRIDWAVVARIVQRAPGELRAFAKAVAAAAGL